MPDLLIPAFTYKILYVCLHHQQWGIKAVFISTVINVDVQGVFLIYNLPNCYTTPNKMTSEDDIKGLVY
jgi:hypothetical protein